MHFFLNFNHHQAQRYEFLKLCLNDFQYKEPHYAKREVIFQITDILLSQEQLRYKCNDIYYEVQSQKLSTRRPSITDSGTLPAA